MIWLGGILGWLGLSIFAAWAAWRYKHMQQNGKTYQIAADGKSIKCLRCGWASWHPEDVRQVYCAHCHRFHVR